MPSPGILPPMLQVDSLPTELSELQSMGSQRVRQDTIAT